MQGTEGLALFAAREDDEDVEVVSELLLLIVTSWTTELTAWTLQSEHAQALPHTDVEEEEEEEVAEDDEEEDDEDEDDDVREASASGSPLALRQALPPSSPPPGVTAPH